ncbi:hypothetical protein [Cystobacter ferrugineus]|uniref:hypothetical protein n=1 Tax=Cystobacter ferrugineus TaxID=83449 RepID=UPI0011612A76|nr:hypothetical protein [Cystobacter ferrugineus]
MSSTAAFLLDADSVIHLHSLGLIDAICAALQLGMIEVHCTRYVWEQELTHLRSVRERLVSAGLQVHVLTPKEPAGQTFKQMLRERGNPGRNSKGENELIAFARHAKSSITLVARDDGARSVASSHRIQSMDVAAFICELVCLDALPEAVARDALAPWDSPHAGNGRPKGYNGFDPMLATWRSKRSSV